MPFPWLSILFNIKISSYPLKFWKIIAYEIKIWVSRPNTGYPFPCLITNLCQDAKVPEIAGVDQEVPVKRTDNPMRYDKTHPRLVLDKEEWAAPDPVAQLQTTIPNTNLALDMEV